MITLLYISRFLYRFSHLDMQSDSKLFLQKNQVILWYSEGAYFLQLSPSHALGGKGEFGRRFYECFFPGTHVSEREICFLRLVHFAITKALHSPLHKLSHSHLLQLASSIHGKASPARTREHSSIYVAKAPPNLASPKSRYTAFISFSGVLCIVLTISLYLYKRFYILPFFY